MAIFAKSEKDAGFGFRTPAGKFLINVESHRATTMNGNWFALRRLRSEKKFQSLEVKKSALL